MSQYTPEQVRQSIRNMAGMLEQGEWADLLSTDPDIARLNAAISATLRQAARVDVTDKAVKRALSTFNVARNYDGDVAGVAMRKVLTEFAALEAALSGQPAPSSDALDRAEAAWNESAFTGGAGLRDRLREVLQAAQPAERQGEAVARVSQGLTKCIRWNIDPSDLADGTKLYTHHVAPVGVPDGMVLVPAAASAEMLDAAIDAFDGFNGEDEVDAVWAAMLAAALASGESA